MNELMERGNDGETIYLDCKICGVPTQLTEDHPVLMMMGKAKVKTYCEACFDNNS